MPDIPTKGALWVLELNGLALAFDCSRRPLASCFTSFVNKGQGYIRPAIACDRVGVRLFDLGGMRFLLGGMQPKIKCMFVRY
jgi:hypothetical protein